MENKTKWGCFKAENPKKKKLNFIKTLLFFIKQGVEGLNELQNS